VATAKPKYSAAAFRKLLAKLAAAKAEASGKVEAQIKAICELASPGFGNRFIDLFRKQWGSPEDAKEYLYRRNQILVWLGEFAAAKRKRDIEKVKELSAIFKANRDRRMVEEFRQKRASPSYQHLSDSDLKAKIGKDLKLPFKPLKRSAAIEAIDRQLNSQKLK
jgi:hypothetical protein